MIRFYGLRNFWSRLRKKQAPILAQLKSAFLRWFFVFSPFRRINYPFAREGGRV